MRTLSFTFPCLMIATLSLLPATPTPAFGQQKTVYWAGTYSGLWVSDTSASNPQQIINPWRVPGEHSIASGLFYDAPTRKIYFTYISDDVKKIQRMDMDGTNVEDVVTGSFMGRCKDLVLDDQGNIYWTDGTNGRIRSQTVNTSGYTDLYVATDYGVCGLAVDTDHDKLYWAEFTTNKICRSNLDGSQKEDIVIGLDNPRYLDLDLVNGKVYWTEYGSDLIQRADLDGSNQELLYASAAELGGIALDPVVGVMYWRDTNGLLTARMDGSLAHRLTFDGGDTYPQDVVLTPEPTTLIILLGVAGCLAGKRRCQSNQPHKP